jgi:oligoribonuclease
MASNNLVWLDCEMTGLDTQKDRLIELAFIITDGSLRPVTESIEDCSLVLPIKQTEATLGTIAPEWFALHERNGLIQRVRNAEHGESSAEDMIISFLKKWCGQKPVLCGNSIHMYPFLF